MTRKHYPTETPAAYRARMRAHGTQRARAVAFAAPVGDEYMRTMTDSSCDGCGYLQCSCPPCAHCGGFALYCRGRCVETGAPRVEPPAPVAAPATGEHAWARVGMRVRALNAPQGEGVVIGFKEPFVLVRLAGRAYALAYGARALEPAEEPAP
jgi:hypothetical protein